MNLVFSSLLTLTIFTKNVISHGAGHDHGGGLMDADKDITDHDLEHLKDAIKTQKPIKEMSKDERQFYYFKQADTDNNDKLDGLEMLQTMIKFEIEDAEYNGQPFKPKEDHEWIEQIDKALKVQDSNNDGMVDFFEFQAVRNRNKNKQVKE
jgi:hypothetical protein